MRQQFLKFISIFVFFVGLSVIFGWVFNVPILTSFILGFATMKFTTAVCFVFAGLILFFSTKHQIKNSNSSEMIILLSSFVIFILMFTMLLSLFFDIQTGLENLFVREIDTLDESIPGFPSMGTMIAFILLAVSGLVVISQPLKQRKMLFTTGTVIALLGFVSLLGYALKIPELYWQIKNVNTAMAIHTATLFLLLGIGFALLSKENNIENNTQDLTINKKHTQFFIAVTSLVFLLVILYSALFGSNMKVLMANSSITRLESIAYFQELRILETIRKYEIISDGISSITQLKKEIQIVNNQNNITEGNGKIQSIIIDASEPFKEIKEIAVFDNKDNLLLISPQKEKYKEYDFLYKTKLKDKNFIISRTANGHSLFLINPIVLEGNVIGTLVFDFGNQLFEDVVRDYDKLGETGETLLAYENEDGNVEFLTNVRDTKKGRIVNKIEISVPVVSALLYKKDATFESAKDYRNVPVVAVTKYIKEVNWGMVVKMDKSEIFSPIQDIKNTILLISAIFIFFSMMVLFIMNSKFK